MSFLSQPTGSGPALVLRAWPTGETSVVASLLTAEHGPVRVVAKGGRIERSRLRPLVQPGRLVDLEYTLVPGRELQYLRGGELRLDPLAAGATLERSVYLQASLEVVDRCRPGDGQDPALFALCADYVTVLSCAGADQVAALYFAFEIALLDLHGMRPQVTACVNCGVAPATTAEDRAWVDPAAGGLVCAACGGGRGGAGTRTLSADALAAWAEIGGAPRRWPQAPLARVCARDWGVLLHRFLEYHLPGYRLPAALNLLRVGAAAGASSEENAI